MSVITRHVPDELELRKLHYSLPIGAQHDAERSRLSAMWFVWGFQKGKGGEQDQQDAWDFGLAFWEHALAYVGDQSYHMFSVQDAFDLWRETGKIERP